MEKNRMNSEDTYGNVAEFYDYVAPYRNRADVDFFVELATQAKGTVLEIGCGTGRVLIPSARAGVEITGLDNSPSMLAMCSNKLAREPEDVQARAHLVEADMRLFDLGRKFALITTPFRPFQHLVDIQDQLSCLRSIRRHLTEDGLLVLDLFNPDLRKIARQMERTGPFEDEEMELEFTMPDGRKVVRTMTVLASNPIEQTLDLEQIYNVKQLTGATSRQSQRFFLRYFFRFEIEHLLKLAGFHIQNVYAGYDKSPLGSTYPGELIYIAKIEGA